MSKKDSNLFYSLQNQTKIALAKVEAIFMALDTSPDTSMEEVLLSVGVDESDLEQTALAITNWFNPENSEDVKSKSAKNSVKIGTAFHDTLSKAGFTEVCLLVADYDIAHALHLYHEEDFRLVLYSFKLKTKMIMAEATTTYEAMAAVFGGGEGASSGEETVIDMSEGLKGGMITG